MKKDDQWLGKLAGCGVACLAGMLLPLQAGEPIPERITIGEPGNPPDENGYGSVSYRYEITRERILNRQYVNFLNQVDPTGENRLGLHHPSMAISSQGGIVRDATLAEGEKYQLKPGLGEQPVFFVDWPSAARFANWLENGAGPESATEVGSYDLVASQGGPTVRQPKARFVVANENEWYKAAWYYLGSEREGAARSGYSRLTRWPGSLHNGAVVEVVDRGSFFDGLQPVVNRKRESVFPYTFVTSRQGRGSSGGFRMVVLVPAMGRDGKEVLPPVGELIDPEVIGYDSPGLWPGSLLMTAPASGFIIDREIEERDPAS